MILFYDNKTGTHPMLTANGNTVQFGDITYEFSNAEDANGFADCINKGGRPASCAEKWHCKNKIKKEKSPSRGLSLS